MFRHLRKGKISLQSTKIKPTVLVYFDTETLPQFQLFTQAANALRGKLYSVTVRLPEVCPSFHDMFNSMENQSAYDIFKALLVTAENYGSTMVDVYLENFIPPPPFRSTIAIPSTKQKPKNTTWLYDLRDVCADHEYESPEDWPHPQSDTLPVPKTGRAALREDLQTLSKLPGVLSLNFASLSENSRETIVVPSTKTANG